MGKHLPADVRQLPQNQDLAHNPKKDGTSQFGVRVREGFPNAFKQRTVAAYVDANTSPAPAGQSTPGAIIVNSESGFFNPSFPAISGRGTDAVVNLGAAAALSGVLRRVDSDAGAFTPSAAGKFDIVPVSVNPATATGVAVYEVLNSSPVSLESADIPVYVAYVTKGNKRAATGTANVSVYLTPASATGQASLTDPLPRFVNNSSPVPAFTIAP